MKAMILAAGRGERMRPLTDLIPKPLVPYKGGSLIDPLLRSLQAAGIQEVVINVCYLAEKMMNYLGTGDRYGIRIHYSHEQEPGGLETGGGVLQALPMLGSQPFLLVSADIVTDFPFKSLIQKSINHLAHLVFVDNPSFHPRGDFHLNPDGLVEEQGTNMLTYSSIGILHPDLFKDCSPGKFPLIHLFRKAIQTQQMTGEYFQGNWANIGTVEQLNEINNQ